MMPSIISPIIPYFFIRFLDLELVSSWMCQVPMVSIPSCTGQLRNCHLTGGFRTTFPLFLSPYFYLPCKTSNRFFYSSLQMFLIFYSFSNSVSSANFFMLFSTEHKRSHHRSPFNPPPSPCSKNQYFIHTFNFLLFINYLSI